MAISDFLAKDMSPLTGNYKKFFELREGDLSYTDEEIKKKKRREKSK